MRRRPLPTVALAPNPAVLVMGLLLLAAAFGLFIALIVEHRGDRGRRARTRCGTRHVQGCGQPRQDVDAALAGVLFTQIGIASPLVAGALLLVPAFVLIVAAHGRHGPVAR
ncbi:MAG: hypothetical protein R3E65_05245 [Steroidobacteraceae bacterium]